MSSGQCVFLRDGSGQVRQRPRPQDLGESCWVPKSGAVWKAGAGCTQVFQVRREVSRHGSHPERVELRLPESLSWTWVSPSETDRAWRQLPESQAPCSSTISSRPFT